ncbi:MAG: 50S ribosomal protein L6 [Candidatus Pacebacteria bacterium]|nr:50S ribosomal protein L6 [Candidatus Paceibacterota bacterium]
MSRLSKKPITIPQGTEVSISDGNLTVKGSLGTLSRMFKDDISIEVTPEGVALKPKRKNLFTKALVGTYASHIKNMIDGVNKEYEKKLIVEGVGFKADVEGTDLKMALGFSHPVIVAIPEGLKVTSLKNEITIVGMDKELVGQYAAKIRAMKKPEPYKGKGIRYIDEVIRRKQGKKAV